MRSICAVPWMRLLAATCTTLVSSAAFAQGVGFQGGLTINPEQVYVGTHVELPLGSDQIVLRPAIDGGFGSGLRVAAIGAEIQYRIELGNSGWRLSQGFGPGVYVARFASGFANEEATDVSGAWTYAFGIVHEGGFLHRAQGRGQQELRDPDAADRRGIHHPARTAVSYERSNHSTKREEGSSTIMTRTTR